jgi:hypothetical protein
MTTFMAGLTIGNKDFCIFSMSPLTEMTVYHSSDIAVAMAYLSDKVNQDPGNLKEVINIHTRLFNAFSPKVYVELEKPLHIGIGSIIDYIRAAGVPVRPYFRQE